MLRLFLLSRLDVFQRITYSDNSSLLSMQSMPSESPMHAHAHAQFPAAFKPAWQYVSSIADHMRVPMIMSVIFHELCISLVNDNVYILQSVSKRKQVVQRSNCSCKWISMTTYVAARHHLPGVQTPDHALIRWSVGGAKGTCLHVWSVSNAMYMYVPCWMPEMHSSASVLPGTFSTSPVVDSIAGSSSSSPSASRRYSVWEGPRKMADRPVDWCFTISGSQELDEAQSEYQASELDLL